MVRRIDNVPSLPPREPESHKGDYGRVLIVAGSEGMTGAGCLAALAAQRSGAGLVTLALPRSLHFIAECKLTSAMSRPLPDPDGPFIGEEAADVVLDWAGEFDAAALGPGVGRAEGTGAAMRRLAAELPVPAVIDADGLNALAEDPDVLRGAAAPRVLTPHPGEMARLAGLANAGEVQSAREEVALEFAQRFGVTVALKGAGTVVTDGERVYVNPTGNPGMASGGVGDVLTGVMVSLLGRGLPAFDAAVLGVLTHGLAGDLVAAEMGETGMVAEDVLDSLPLAFRRLAGGRPG
jgi:NAD(P)H-hydrate epimerase